MRFPVPKSLVSSAPRRRTDVGRWDLHDDSPSPVPGCGDVKLQIHDLTVRVCTDEITPGGVPVPVPDLRPRPCTGPPARGSSTSSSPPELSTSSGHGRPRSIARPDGPPLTPDDLLDLHVLLADDDWFDDLVALVRRTTPE